MIKGTCRVRNAVVSVAVLWCCALIAAAPAAWTAILDVPGTYPTLAAAAAACAAGDTINITASYVDTGGSATVTGGTPLRNNVTIQGNGFTVTCGAATAGGAVCFKNVTGGVVQNLTINGNSVAQNLLFVDGSSGGGATSVTATNCTFHGSTSNGIRASNAGANSGATLTATGCRSHSNGGHGLALQQNAAATIVLCQFDGNAQAGIATPNAASSLTVRDTVIRDNSAAANFGQVHYANTSPLTHEFDRCQIYGDSPVAVIYKTATAGAVNLTLVNCIVRRGEAGPSVPPQLINLGTNTQTVTMSHCTLLGAVSGYLFAGSATTITAYSTILDSSAAGLGARAGALAGGLQPNIAWRSAGSTGFTTVPAGTINQNPNLLSTGYLQAASLPALAAATGSSMALDVDNIARPIPASTTRDIGADEAKGISSITATGAASYAYSGSGQGPDTATVTGSAGARTYSYSGSGYGPSSTKPTNVGTYQVVATVAEDASYFGAVSPPLVFTIDKATPTATLAVSNSPVTYDGAAKAATVGVGTSSTPGTAQNVLTGGAASQAAADTYAVTADFVPADTANYNTVSGVAAGSFVIAKAALTVTADAKTKSAGAPDPELTWQITEGAPASGDSLTGALARAPGETPGTYAILQGTLTAGPNYDLTYAGANLTITPGGAFAVVYTGPNPIIAWPEQRVEITVAAVNAPGDVDYQWYKVSNKALNPVMGARDPTLVIPSASAGDAGFYVCEASSLGETDLTPDIELVVDGAPLPAAGGLGLALAALAAALTGAGALRRRK